MKKLIYMLGLWALLVPQGVLAQGQDSTFWARDAQVLAAMLPGLYANANQVYFERRTKQPRPQRHYEIRIAALDEARHPSRFSVQVKQGDKMQNYVWVLQEDDEARAVRMSIMKGKSKKPLCHLYWQRDAGQFRAAGGDCPPELPTPHGLMLSQRQLFWQLPDKSDMRLHRARVFSCHADMPGVGGGRDEAYKRYDGIRLHDQGGAHRFTATDGRKMALELLRVDWPINNFVGEFARDSLVLYINEYKNNKRVEHGYAFIKDDAPRIGLNLKWILASCYLESNKDTTPFM